MSLDKDFWNEPEQRCELCSLGAYKGVPYLIERQEYRHWDQIVAPEKTAPAGVLLTLGKSEAYCSPVPADYQHSAEEVAKEVLTENFDKIFAQAAQLKAGCLFHDEMKDSHPELVDPATETGAINIAKNVIEEAFTGKDYKKLAELLKIAGVDFIREEMSFLSTDGYTIDTLYINNSGDKITAAQRDQYETLKELVWLWGDDEVYTVETPFGYRDNFCNLGTPAIEDNSPIARYIKAAIEKKLIKTKKARYELDVPHATTVESEHEGSYFDDVKFSSTKRIKLYTEYWETAQRIQESYPENSVKIIDHEKTAKTNF